MKTEIVNRPVKFEPKKVVLTFESQGEINAFVSIFGSSQTGLIKNISMPINFDIDDVTSLCDGILKSLKQLQTDPS